LSIDTRKDTPSNAGGYRTLLEDRGSEKLFDTPTDNWHTARIFSRAAAINGPEAIISAYAPPTVLVRAFASGWYHARSEEDW
jgi:hypothetical protein